MHWEADVDDLKSRLPVGVDLDLYDGKAWLGVIPFDMEGVTLRGCPSVPMLSHFTELNVRTYVRVQGKPGVWFFSLDVPHLHAVWGARTFFHLPYYLAAMKMKRGEAGIDYRSARVDRSLDMRYTPGESLEVSRDSFLQWATSRYCLYCRNRGGDVFRGSIHHAPWALQKVEVEIREQRMLSPFKVGERHPEMAYAAELPVVVYPLEKVRG